MNKEQHQLLLKLNNINSQNLFRKLGDLEIDNEYLITDVEAKNMKYGLAYVLELDNEFKVILPTRYNKILSWEDFRSIIGLKMIYRGMTDSHTNLSGRYIIEFV